MIALVDCNNFYASCERLFAPKLRNRPVVVLSNNDGCVIARSNEAKDLGIVMGAPAFQIKEVVEKNGVAVFSSNYVLYGDLSNRVHRTLAEFTPEIEVYSIDECFLNLSGFTLIDTYQSYGSKIKRTVQRNTGIPVSVGIAPTKTLAKIANRFAKKHKREIGVHVLDTPEATEAALKATEIGDVWGIGRQYTRKLQAMGVNTAFDFIQLPEAWVFKNMTVVGQRLQKELKGYPCLDLELIRPAKKGICTSRSFGKLLTDIEELREAVSTHATRCAEKLRRQNSCAALLHVFIHTNPFRQQDRQYYGSKVMKLQVSTNSSTELVENANRLLELIYRPGFNYKKAGVIVMEITPESQLQSSLFDTRARGKERDLMQAMDNLTARYGRDTVKIAAQGFSKRWKLKQESLSPCYTTRFDELLTIKI